MRMFILLIFFNCAKCRVNGTAAISDKKQTTTPFRSNHHYIAIESPLTLNCTTWKNDLSSHDLCWRFKDKAWLTDHTTRLDARTNQLRIPKVTFANNGTYRCCTCNATVSSGVVGCGQTDVVLIGEKPKITLLIVGATLSPYGCPPEYMDLSWKAVPSNGEILEYNVWYQLGSRRLRLNKMKRASWCTTHSSSSHGSFSCNLTQIVNRSNSGNVCTDYHYPLCWAISVTNRFGTSSHFPIYSHFTSDILCPTPSVKLMSSGRREITVEVYPLKHMVYTHTVIYNITFCYLGTGFTAKEAEKLEARTKNQSPKSSKFCDSQTTYPSKTNKLVKRKLVSLKDYSQYAVSVSGKIITGNDRYGLVAGPYNVTTWEQAPAEPPSSLRFKSLTSCGDQKRVAVSFELPPLESLRGRPRRFIAQYWQTGNQTRVNKTFPTSVTSLVSGAALSVNITVECYKEFKVRLKICTVECSGWSPVISIAADEHSSTLTTSQPEEKQSVIWKVVVAAGVLGLLLLGLISCIWYQRKRKRESSDGAPSQEPLADRTSGIGPTPDDGVSRPPLTDSNGQYYEQDDVSVADSVHSTSPLLKSNSLDTELFTFDTRDSNNSLAVIV